MKRVVFVTNHYLDTHHKAGFHWLAEAFWRAGWHVVFLTESISWLSYLRRDARCQYPLFRESHRLRYVRERFASYVWLTPFHPINLRSRLINRLSTPIFKLYGQFPLGAAAPEIAHADLFIFDSDHGLFLFDRFKRLNPDARYVYRVSDDIPMMRHHPLVPSHEEQVLPRFDLVSVPSSFFLQRFAGRPNVALHYHGLEKELFDRSWPNPYATAGPNVLYVGKNQFDRDAIVRAVKLFPHWSFHVIGAIGSLTPANNLTCYGERPFVELVPFLQHADIGLQTLIYTPGAECFTDSLKMHQYTYCRLPILAPMFLKNPRPHVFYYQPGDDESIREALLAASRYDRTQIAVDSVLSWDQIARTLAA